MTPGSHWSNICVLLTCLYVYIWGDIFLTYVHKTPQPGFSETYMHKEVALNSSFKNVGTIFCSQTPRSPCKVQSTRPSVGIVSTKTCHGGYFPSGAWEGWRLLRRAMPGCGSRLTCVCFPWAGARPSQSIRFHDRWAGPRLGPWAEREAEVGMPSRHVARLPPGHGDVCPGSS